MPTMLALLLAAAPIEGKWTNPANSVTIAIGPCGEALCGTVVWASDKAKADAARGGTAELVGATLLSGFSPAGKGKWRGRLFVPDMNKRVRADLSLTSAASLKVRGCLVGKAVCRSQTWSRAD